MRAGDYKVDISDTLRDLRTFPRKFVAPAVGKAMKTVTRMGAKAGRKELDRGLEIRSRTYILKHGVKNTPNTTYQVDAIERSFLGKGQAFGNVRIRGASQEKNKLDFIRDSHEKGINTRAHGRNSNLSVPTQYLKSRRYRTALGRTKKSYKPETLLEKTKARKAKNLISATRNSKGKKGKKYLMEITSRGKKYYIIAKAGGKRRRKRVKVKAMYSMQPTAAQKRRTMFRYKVAKTMSAKFRRTTMYYLHKEMKYARKGWGRWSK